MSGLSDVSAMQLGANELLARAEVFANQESQILTSLEASVFAFDVRGMSWLAAVG